MSHFRQFLDDDNVTEPHRWGTALSWQWGLWAPRIDPQRPQHSQATAKEQPMTTVSVSLQALFRAPATKKNNTACLQSSHIISSSVLAAERGGHAGEELAIYIILKWFKTNEVSIQPSPAWDFWPLESSHFVSYFISYITVAYSVPFALDLFDCGFRVRISSRVRASISFVFLHIFPFPCRLKDRKLPPSRLPRWLSSSMLRLYYTGHGFESHATIIFYVLKVFCKVFCKLELGLGKWRWRVSSGQKSCASAGCIDTA